MEIKELGPLAYIAGIVVALLAGFLVPGSAMIALVIAVLGLIVGLLNVADKEVQLFLVASVAFIVGASSLAGVISGLFVGVPLGIGAGFVGALQYMIAFTAPAAAVIGLLALHRIRSA